MGKINLNAIKEKGVQDTNVLEKVTKQNQEKKPIAEPKIKQPKKEYLNAHVKINMTPTEKARLEKKAGYNISAFLRDKLIELKLI